MDKRKKAKREKESPTEPRKRNRSSLSSARESKRSSASPVQQLKGPSWVSRSGEGRGRGSGPLAAGLQAILPLAMPAAPAVELSEPQFGFVAAASPAASPARGTPAKAPPADVTPPGHTFSLRPDTGHAGRPVQCRLY